MTLARSALLAVLLSLTPALGASDWTKYVSDDGGFSLHYPAGWSAEESDSGLVVQSEETSEVVLLLTFESEGRDSARACAEAACEVFTQQDWAIEPLAWQPDDGDANPVTLHFSAAIEGTDLLGDALVTLEEANVLWLSYMAPSEAYDRARATSVLQGIASSLEEGRGSKPPTVRLRGGRADELARAFVFVLEFALGDPLSADEEKQVIESLLESWDGQPDEALEAFAPYPDLVRAILSGDRDSLEELQRDLGETTRQWLDESDPNDPVVALVRAHQEAADEELVGGDEPLTRREATAYAEMTAYSLLLRESPLAMPEEADPELVGVLEQGLADAWPGLTSEERRQVAAAPAVWMCLRSVAERGSPEERAQARELVMGAGAAAEEEGQPIETPDEGDARTIAENMVRHQVMLNINQMTFNQYMWSHGLHQTMRGW